MDLNGHSELSWRKDKLNNVLYHRTLGIKYKNKSGVNIKGSWLDIYLIKLLITSTSRTYKKMAPTISNQGDILYDNGKLLIRNRGEKSMDCFSVIENVQNIRKLWSVDSRPSNRWEDHTILQTDLHPDYNHPSLFVLRSPSKLERYDLKTGTVLASLKLYKDVKFTEMAIDEDKNWLTIKGIRSASNPSQARKEMIMRFIILDLLPLQYKYHIVLKKSCLGANVRDVIISSGLIMVLRQTNEIQFFNLLPFLAQATEVETSKVDGFYPNVEIQDLGPCIFTINSYQHFLIICENQLNFLKKHTSQEFHLCSLQDSKVIGKFYSSSNVFDDQDQVHYLGDNSGRLVQTGNSSIRIFATDTRNSQTVTKEVFRYQAETMTVPRDKGPQYSRSGREIRRSIEVPPTEFTYVKFDYEDELDILGLLIVSDQLSDQEESIVMKQTILTTIQEVRLYDGLRFNLLRVVPINFTAVRPCGDVSGLVQLCLDRDVMMIKIKGNSQTLMIPYQIGETNVSTLKIMIDS